MMVVLCGVMMTGPECKDREPASTNSTGPRVSNRIEVMHDTADPLSGMAYRLLPPGYLCFGVGDLMLLAFFGISKYHTFSA